MKKIMFSIGLIFTIFFCLNLNLEAGCILFTPTQDGWCNIVGEALPGGGVDFNMVCQEEKSEIFTPPHKCELPQDTIEPVE